LSTVINMLPFPFLNPAGLISRGLLRMNGAGTCSYCKPVIALYRMYVIMSVIICGA
jgi:hypothetical protein